MEHEFEHKGYRVKIDVFRDDDIGPPWEVCDGHGPVSDYVRARGKLPGEKVLVEDHGFARYYDWAEATKIAKRDGWGLGDKEKQTLAESLGKSVAELTPGEITSEAVRKDFEYLRGWCNDEWEYVQFSCTISEGDTEVYDFGVGGYDDEDYAVEEASSQARHYIDQLA